VLYLLSALTSVSFSTFSARGSTLPALTRRMPHEHEECAEFIVSVVVDVAVEGVMGGGDSVVAGVTGHLVLEEDRLPSALNPCRDGAAARNLDGDAERTRCLFSAATRPAPRLNRDATAGGVLGVMGVAGEKLARAGDDDTDDADDEEEEEDEEKE
jgi:hypothetical protein